MSTAPSHNRIPKTLKNIKLLCSTKYFYKYNQLNFINHPHIMDTKKHLARIRILIASFGIVVALSGITAFPVEMELRWLLSFKKHIGPGLEYWLQTVYDGVKDTNHKYGFLLYGYDWLAFAHLVIALMFIGAYKDPVKNIWVIEWAMIACVCVIPLALLAGPVRGIPLYWQLIDCSFGVIGIIPLWLCRRWIKEMEVAAVYSKIARHSLVEQ
jgi:hypothetical protein